MRPKKGEDFSMVNIPNCSKSQDKNPNLLTWKQVPVSLNSVLLKKIMIKEKINFKPKQNILNYTARGLTFKIDHSKITQTHENSF